MLYLELTHNCNLSCSFCIRDKIKNGKELSAELAIEYIKQYQSKTGDKTVGINGYGENLLSKDFIEVLEFASENSDYVYFSTNGLALKGNLADRIARINFDRIVFSLTGYAESVFVTAQGHGNINPEKLFEKIKENIINFIKLRDKYQTKTRIWIQYIYTEDRCDDLKNYFKYWGGLVDEISVTSLNSSFGNNFDNNEIKVKKYKPCNQIGNVNLIHSNGDVSICCSDALRSATIGNVFDSKISEIIDSQKYRSYILANQSGNYMSLPDICLKCDSLEDKFLMAAKYTDIKAMLSWVSTIPLNKKISLVGVTDKLSSFIILAKLYRHDLKISVFDTYKTGYIGSMEIKHPSKIDGESLCIVFCSAKFNFANETYQIMDIV